MSLPILTLAIQSERDVAFARQRARRVAELLGLGAQDQVRVATAVSELARNAFTHGGGGTATFALDEKSDPQALVVTISDRGPGIADLDGLLEGRSSEDGFGVALVGARRLMDRFRIESAVGQGVAVEIAKDRPRQAKRLTAAAVAELTKSLRNGPEEDSESVVVAEQNRALMFSLQELQDRQLELQRVNDELADTNRGVVALYAELEDAANQVRRASESKSRFLSSITHEFRTPLNSVLALSRLLLDRVDGDLSPEQAKQVELIRTSAANLSQLVDDLLDLAKIEAGKFDLRPSTFSIDELFRALRASFKPLLIGSAVDLVFEPAPARIGPFHTDEGKVTQILRNFISNALKFTEKGEVRVSVARDAKDGHFRILVRDTGIGIDRAHHERIFEEFAQVPSALQRKARGTGLGLPLSRRLAELMGGSVEVESALGAGSTFILNLPASVAAGADVAPRARKKPSDKLKVLVIDDDPTFRYVIGHMIKSARAAMIMDRDDGATGLSAVRSEAPDVIFLDLQMPGLDGWSVLEGLAHDAALKSVPVVVLTSLSLETQQRARLTHAHMVLSKDDLSTDVIDGALKSIFPQSAAKETP